jgi:predicted aspartyl protease
MGPTSTRPIDGLLDTGADDTIFPDLFAARIGVDLAGAPRGQATTADRTPVLVRYAHVVLRLTDGTERREWPAWVGFSPTIRSPLLGFAGFLQFFTATFHGDREQIELTVNGLYPGT